MAKVSTQPYKGARDFYPEDKRRQQWLFSKWKTVIERYGYEEYDAPILEPTDLYLMKGSQEIVEEQTYTFKDRGDRSVTIRTEMTPSVSRMIAGKRQELAYPVRWYSIPNLWRYERMQRGRLREFWQLNVDIFGVASEAAELEMIQLIDDIFQEFRANRSTYTIKLNSRVLMNDLLADEFGLDEDDSTKLIRLIDRKAKMPEDDFMKQVATLTSIDKAQQLKKILETNSLDDLPKKLADSDSAKALQALLDDCKSFGITNVEFDATLMRGFDYYTDIVFEVFDTGGENQRAMLGGGRYDGLVGQFGAEPVPTVGFGMGDVVFMDYLETYKLLPKNLPKTELVVVVRDASETKRIQKIAAELREMGVNTAVDYSERKVDKQFKSALKTDVKFGLFVGAEELDSEQFVLKDLVSGKEQKHSLQRIVSIVKDSRATSKK